MYESLNQEKIYPLTVVIATLGGDTLIKTITQLNKGSLIPSEILVCIPEIESENVQDISVQNVKIVATECRGQVAQRAIGFQSAKNDYVLQLDDDIYVRDTCLQNLVNCMVRNTNTVVGPKLHDIKSGKYYSFMTLSSNNTSWFNRLMFWVINGRFGYEPGKISKSGINMGLPENGGDWIGVDWLPGGCLLHHKKNLIIKDFYPFKGKAFAEDLYHSALLKKNGVKLVRCDDAACDVDFSSDIGINPVRLVKSYYKYICAMKGLNINGIYSMPRLYCGIFLTLIEIASQKLMSPFQFITKS